MAAVDLLVSDANSVRTLTLNRPDVGNALDTALIRGLTEAIEAADADEQVRVVVLTGTGKTFCGGLDMAALRDPAWDPSRWNNALALIRGATTPVIASVNGATSTAGLGLLLACDFAIASERATFSDLHAKVGLISASGMSTLLVDRIGLARAKEMWLTARRIDAATACRWGLVNDVVPGDELANAVLERAAAIAQVRPEWVRAVIAAHDQGKQAVLARQFSAESEAAVAWAARGDTNER